MGIREVLQTEIWSKETSRKILAKVWKIAKYAGISIGVVFVALALFVFVWTHWLTAKEHRLGKTALAQIDELQNFEGMNDVEFDAQVNRAEVKVDATNTAVLTAKDNEVAVILRFYLDQIKWARKREKQIQEISELHPESMNSERYRQSGLKIEQMNRDEIKMFKDSAHELLDK